MPRFSIKTDIRFGNHPLFHNLSLENQCLCAELPVDGAPAHLQPSLHGLFLAEEQAFQIRPHLKGEGAFYACM
jgi:hypothetical protein